MVKLIAPPEVFGATVFCDDTRVEASGKLIHIGVYQGIMAIHAPFPVRLPTFSFAITLWQRAEVFAPKLIYRIFLPGDPDDATSDEASIVAERDETNPGDAIKQANSRADAMGIASESGKYLHTFANMAFQTLEIKQPGEIKVRVDIGGNRYRLGLLTVVSAPSA
jgi:hypothetical protein